VGTIVRAAAAGLWLLGAACSGGSPQSALTEANERLAASDWSGAAQRASEALEQKGGEAGLRWKLELVRLEALARGGEGAKARLQVQRLAAEYPPQVTPDVYATTAEQLREAGDPASALGVLDAGLLRFPTDAQLGAARDAIEPRRPPEGDEAGEELPAPVGGGEEGAAAEEEAAEQP
jgi:hypothetical protein